MNCRQDQAKKTTSKLESSLLNEVSLTLQTLHQQNIKHPY